MTPEQLIQRFIAVWGEPKTDYADTFIAEYQRILAGQPANVLTLTGDLCVDQETYWPRPADVLRHLWKARERLIKYTPPEHQPIEDGPPVDPEMRARVGELMKELAKKLSVAQEPLEEKKNYWRDVTRPAFEDMQRNSPNQFLHRNLRNPAGGN